MALGKGLSALIPEKSNRKNEEGVFLVKTATISDSSQQPRSNYDSEKLNQLKESIKENGMLQPILVRPTDKGFEVVAGERRLKAARALGLEDIPVVVKNISDKESLVLALIENIQREELNPIEEAKAFEKLMKDFSFSQEDVAASVGKDRATISNALRLLSLPAFVQTALMDGVVSMGQARTLIGIASERETRKIFDEIVQGGLSVREVEKLVMGTAKKESRRAKTQQRKSHEILMLEESLQKVFGTKVEVQAKKEKGKIIIDYYSLSDLERILNYLKKVTP